MQSKRSYRDAPADNIRLPKEVYYRCIWTVRDSERLKLMASVLNMGSEEHESDAYGDVNTATSSVYEDAVVIRDESAEKAAFELRCIDAALKKIPEVYREGLLDNIIYKTPFSDFAHQNTWKRWKLVFLFELARELRMI